MSEWSSHAVVTELLIAIAVAVAVAAAGAGAGARAQEQEQKQEQEQQYLVKVFRQASSHSSPVRRWNLPPVEGGVEGLVKAKKAGRNASAMAWSGDKRPMRNSHDVLGSRDLLQDDWLKSLSRCILVMVDSRGIASNMFRL